MTLFNNSLSDKSSNSIDNKLKSIPNFLQKENNDGHKDLSQFDNVDTNEALEILSGNKLDMNNNNFKTTDYKNIDDPILEEMQRQSQV